MIANGRIDILQPPNALSLQEKPTVHTSTYHDAMTGNWSDTPLSRAFFSVQNQQILQNGIRAGVYQRSRGKYVIGEQSITDLKMIMRALFLEHSQNRPIHITDQIIELNGYVLDYCVPRVLGEAQGYLKYIQDASTLVVPLAHPIHTSNDKTLELKSFF
jgi:hypothetical protein